MTDLDFIRARLRRLEQRMDMLEQRNLVVQSAAEVADQLVGESLLDALELDAGPYDSAGNSHAVTTTVPSSAGGPPDSSDPVETREPLMAEERYSAPLRVGARIAFWRAPGQARCGVYAGELGGLLRIELDGGIVSISPEAVISAEGGK